MSTILIKDGNVLFPKEDKKLCAMGCWTPFDNQFNRIFGMGIKNLIFDKIHELKGLLQKDSKEDKAFGELMALFDMYEKELKNDREAN